MHDRVAHRVARRAAGRLPWAIVAAVTVTVASFGLTACQSEFLPAQGDWRSAVSPSPTPSVTPAPSREPEPSASASPAEPAPEPAPGPTPDPAPDPTPG